MDLRTLARTVLGPAWFAASLATIGVGACHDRRGAGGVSGSGGHAEAGGDGSGAGATTGGGGRGPALGGGGGPATGGGGPGAGGAAAGGATSGGPAGGREAAVVPGTCGVARRIPLPGPASLRGPIWRSGGGFTLGPHDAVDGSPTPISWGHLDTNGANGPALTVYAAGSGIDGSPLASFGVGPPDHLVQIVLGAAGSGSPGTNRFYDSLLLTNGGTMPLSRATLLDSYYRGSIRTAAGPALDGQRGVFVVGHVGVAAPQIAVFGSEGTRLGDVTEVPTVGTPGSWDCDTVRPTDHAGAFALVDHPPAPATGEIFRLLEMTASGDVELATQIPLQRVRFGTSGIFCPLISLASDGFAFLVFEAPTIASGSTPGADDGAWHLHRIARDGITADETWDTLPGAPIALAIDEDSAVAISKVPDGIIIVKRTNGQDQRFPLAKEDAVGTIPSEAGTVFLAGSGAVGSTDWKEIVEVACSR